MVGTKGRSLGGFQGLLPGSVSKYCLQHSPVPVIVVRPSSKRDKARNKRALDPSRHAYKDLLEKSGHLLDPSDPRSMNTEDSRVSSLASEEEAAAVAAAIGYKPVGGSPLVQTQTTSDHGNSTTALDELKSPGIMMKSPELQNLDSPEISDSSSSDDEGGVSTDVTAVGLGVDEEDASPKYEKTPEDMSKTKPNVADEEVVSTTTGNTETT